MFGLDEKNGQRVEPKKTVLRNLIKSEEKIAQFCKLNDKIVNHFLN
jgi:hypothetical protein